MFENKSKALIIGLIMIIVLPIVPYLGTSILKFLAEKYHLDKVGSSDAWINYLTTTIGIFISAYFVLYTIENDNNKRKKDWELKTMSYIRLKDPRHLIVPANLLSNSNVDLGFCITLSNVGNNPIRNLKLNPNESYISFFDYTFGIDGILYGNYLYSNDSTDICFMPNSSIIEDNINDFNDLELTIKLYLEYQNFASNDTYVHIAKLKVHLYESENSYKLTLEQHGYSLQNKFIGKLIE